jgi:ubiquinone/menaquinone biosynthesis C-methylase UbiE
MTNLAQMREGWDRYAETYDEAFTPYCMRVAEDALDFVGIERGTRVLDVAAGGGALSIPAARRGAEVLATDFSPAMVGRLNARAREEGLSNLESRVMDGHRLELEDDTFDISASQFGIMLFPDRPRALGELARVTKPGGQIALANWTPTGGLAKMFKVMAPYQPAPPPSSPFDWGDEQRARELLGQWFELELEEHVSTLRIPSGEAYWELFSTSYGPTKTLADSLGERREELHRDWVDFFETNYREDGEIVHTREYLLVLGRRR